MKYLLYLFVAVAGAMTSVESGSNAQLAKTLGGQPWWPALLFTAVSAVGLVAAVAFTASPLPTVATLRAVPWWAWLGGLISAVYVISMLVGPGALGAGLFTGLTITAALIASIALDHYGLVGFAVHPAGVGRLLGAALMVAGIILVAVY